MKDYQRKGLLERIDRDGATVGTRIPTRLDLGGEEVALRSLVFEVLDDPAAESRREDLRTDLRRARLERRRRLERGDLDVREGQRVVAEVHGIDRALCVLDRDGDSIEEATARHQATDRKRWLSFVDRVRGEDRRRGR